MFEKEAEEYYETETPMIENITGLDFEIEVTKAYQKGATDGYNKANEWHYNGVPKNDNDILCQIDKDIVVVGYFHQKNKQYYTTSGEWIKTIIAWKEIVLPKES